MIWVRSFPSAGDFAEHNLGQDACFVMDKLPRLIMSGQNYKTISEYKSLGTEDGWPNEDFCMLEWDIALDTQSMRVFECEALMEPKRVLIAPYRWHDTWINYVGNDGRGPTEDSRPVIESDITCDSFGLGCIYLPRAILSEFLSVMDHLGFTDYTFGRWYRQKYGPARLTWRVHPQHLNDYGHSIQENP